MWLKCADRSILQPPGLLFPYCISLFFLARPQSSVPDPKVTSQSTEWMGPGLCRLPYAPWGPKPVL